MITVSELNVYFHSPGQILRTNQINRLSTANRQNVKADLRYSTLLTDWEVTLSIELVDFSEVQGTKCLQEQQSYDQCIISQYVKQSNNSKFVNFIFPNYGLWPPSKDGVPVNIIQEFYSTIISQDAIRRCSKSCSHIHVQYEQKAKRDLSNKFKRFPFYARKKIVVAKHLFTNKIKSTYVFPSSAAYKYAF